MFETLATYFAYPFVRYALIVGVLIALSSSLLGVTLVLKRFSFIGDGLSHVAFGAIAIATILGGRYADYRTGGSLAAAYRTAYQNKRGCSSRNAVSWLAGYWLSAAEYLF